MTIHIGTSGWAYREWRGMFYPPRLKPDGLLTYYATRFNALEINGTAYRTPALETVQRWGSLMPAGFVAAVKLSHAITHHHRLRDSGGLLEDFVIAVRHLTDHLGPILVQLPPGFAPDHVRLRDFLAEARAVMADPNWPLVIEFRHADWLTPRTERLLDDAHATWCVADMPECVVDRPTAGSTILYLRRHGTVGKYRGSYDDTALRRDSDLICGWADRGSEVYAFFNNTADGSAVNDAQRLRQQVGNCVDQDPPSNAKPSGHPS